MNDYELLKARIIELNHGVHPVCMRATIDGCTLLGKIDVPEVCNCVMWTTLYPFIVIYFPVQFIWSLSSNCANILKIY